MKLYIIAGEASGDLHGSNLVKALLQQAPDTQIRAWGGDKMEATGATLAKHYRDLAFMGFVEVLANLRTIMGNLKFCKSDILDFQPDALVLIDYPGFNLRIAKWAKQQGFKVIYYISPQLWAWHSSRVHAIKRDVDKMLVILPFEVDFYKKYGVDVTFVGHPLLDAIAPGTTEARDVNAPKTIALLPGSRKQEVKRILPPMLSVVQYFPDYQFIIAGSPALPAAYYQEFLQSYPNVKLVTGSTYDILRNASAALVKSGTSTLETAIIGTPQIVCYKGSNISYQIAKRVINVAYISLVNLIADRLIVKELIQKELNTENLRFSLAELLQPEHATRMKADYENLRTLLGKSGASQHAAEEILKEANR